MSQSDALGRFTETRLAWIESRAREGLPSPTRDELAAFADGYAWHRAIAPAPPTTKPSGEAGQSYHDFFHEYGMPSMLAPSCLVCGVSQPSRDTWAIQHMKLPNIIVCTKCRDAAVPHSVEQEVLVAPLESLQRLWMDVRLRAEGSDWKRDQGETLYEWVWRTLGKRP